MDKSQDMVSMLERPKISVSGYTIEMGNTTYGQTLEERIQAARAASSSSQPMPKTNNKGKSSSMNYRNIEKDNNFHNIDIENKTFSAHELKEKNRQQCQSSSKKDFVSTTSSLNSTIVRNGNINPQVNYNSSCLSKPIYKGGGLMQRRLESIKANKRLAYNISLDSNKNVGSTKCSNYLSQNTSRQDTFTKNHEPNQFGINVSKPNEYKTRSTIQKNLSNDIQHNSCINSNTNKLKNSETSVQYRLIRAKEEMKTNSKIEIIKKDSSLDNVQQNNNLLKHNIYNKTKRLSRSNQTTTKNVSTIASNSKKCILNNSNINKILDKQLITVQQKPVVPRSMNLSKPSDTVMSTNIENEDILKKLKEKEINSFSFVMPQTNSVSQRLEKRNKYNNYTNTQYNENDSMDWECISEPSQIVDKVNDLRKITHAYEPMECTPDTIMHCDLINYCLVIDTNILLSDLKSITIVIDKYLPDYNDYLTIVLPWRVLQELDCIKKSENALGYRAREATRWLLEMLSKNHPRLKGQPMTTNNNYNTNADDSILKCAMLVKERVNNVTLVTDDKILSIKSEINGICVKNSAWLQNLVSPVKNPRNSKIFQEIVKKYPIIENKLIMQFESYLEHIIARVLKFAVGQNNDYSIFTKKAWWKMYSLTPPLNLTKCLSKLKEHWNIIAPQQFMKRPQEQLDWLECFFKDLQETILSKNSLNWNEIYNLLKYCIEVLTAFPYEYYHITDIIFNDLMIARKCLKRKLDCVVIDDESLSNSLTNNLNISSVNSFHNLDNVLSNILKDVDMFRLYTYKSKGINCSSFEQLNCSLPKHFGNEIENYCHKLSNIINIMLKIKKFKIEQILESQLIIDTFLKAITDFDDNLINITKENIIDFCLNKNKNSFVSVLISFQNNLAAMKNLVTSISS